MDYKVKTDNSGNEVTYTFRPQNRYIVNVFGKTQRVPEDKKLYAEVMNGIKQYYCKRKYDNRLHRLDNGNEVVALHCFQNNHEAYCYDFKINDIYIAVADFAHKPSLVVSYSYLWDNGYHSPYRDYPCETHTENCYLWITSTDEPNVAKRIKSYQDSEAKTCSTIKLNYPSDDKVIKIGNITKERQLSNQDKNAIAKYIRKQKPHQPTDIRIIALYEAAIAEAKSDCEYNRWVEYSDGIVVVFFYTISKKYTLTQTGEVFTSYTEHSDTLVKTGKNAEEFLNSLRSANN